MNYFTKQRWVDNARTVWAKHKIIARIAVIFIMIVCINLLFHYFGGAIYRFGISHRGPYETKLYILAGLFYRGVFLGVLKSKWKSWYGNVETIFGLVSGVSIAWGLPANNVPFGKWLALMGCV